MTEPFMGEVQIFGFSFAPRGWALAAGQLVPIRQASALYSLYGSAFGGDGVQTFGLPNLASRMVCGAGQSPGNSRRGIGDCFGTSAVGLNASEMPMHNHIINDYIPGDATTLVSVPTAAAAMGYAAKGAFNTFAAATGQLTAMNSNAIGLAGNGSPHENRQPFLGRTYAGALAGAYPLFN